MKDTWKSIYSAMYKSRRVDEWEQDFARRGEAFFHVAGSGHEASAALVPHLGPQDWLQCHYRDKALMMARGISAKMFFLSLFTKDASHSRGRQMSAHLSDPTLKIHSLVGPVGNSALHATGTAAAVKDRADSPLVLCSLGDGMTQEGEVLEAVAQAVRDSLPVLFLIQDNSFSISTRTPGKTFYSHPEGLAKDFYGIPIRYIDGTDVAACYQAFGETVQAIRKERKPLILVMQVERLTNHTNADDQRMYRSPEEIQANWDAKDPLALFRRYLLTEGIATGEELENLHGAIDALVQQEAEEAQDSPEPEAALGAKKELPKELLPLAQNEKELEPGEGGLTMIDALREVLNHHLKADQRVSLYGEDLEDPKGDVFGVTKGLSTAYPGRVVNSPLSESTIVGHSIGRALAGERPVAFLQFADFFPIAYNQIYSELGSMHWRTDGAWEAPVIVMATTGGYRPGLGPFHASSMETVAAHTPGVDVFIPSNAVDAVGLLNAAFASGRPTIFFYPKNVLNDRSRTIPADRLDHIVPIGRARFLSRGNDLTLVTWGNTTHQGMLTVRALEAEGRSVDLIDLRTLSPWDRKSVIESCRRTRRLLVVHEDNHSAGFGAEVAATVAEALDAALQIRRVTRPDTYVPCNYTNQLEVLPSFKRILEAAADLLGGEVTWKGAAALAEGLATVDAIGSSPSDESITVVEWYIKEGDSIGKGQNLAALEADKAAVDLSSPLAGKVLRILVPQGDTVKVGEPLLEVELQGQKASRKAQTQENAGTPSIAWKSPVAAGSAGAAPGTSPGSALADRSALEALQAPAAGKTAAVAGIVTVAGAKGSRIMGNEAISKLCPDWSPQDIEKRTGIVSRPWMTDEESTLGLAVNAARKALEQSGLNLDGIDMIIATSGTAPLTTPSLACLVLEQLAAAGLGSEPHPQIAAYDINAACSGYLYGLQASHDYLVQQPSHRVLLITAEGLSRKTDTADPMTAPIFGDAATATVIAGARHSRDFIWEVERPILSAKGENGDTLRVHHEGGADIYMDGPKVYVEAVKAMVAMLEASCVQSGINPEGLDLVVAHQANQRILNAVRQKLKAPEEKIYSNIRNNGNTSSSSIPLCLEELLRGPRKEKILGMTAFGGGFTFAGGILRKSE